MISGIGVLLVGSAEGFPAVRAADRCDPRSCGDGCCFFDGLQLASEFLLDHLCVQHCDAVDRPFLRRFGGWVLPDGWILDLSSFQPTELSKILLIMFFARFLMDHEDTLNTWKTILASVALLAVPLVLIKIQPDLKNTITVTVVFCLLMYVAGLSYKIIGVILGIAIPLVIAAFVLITQTDIKIIDSYQKARIMSWLYPEDETYKDDVIQQQNSYHSHRFR